jgi:hypothetical protein
MALTCRFRCRNIGSLSRANRTQAKRARQDRMRWVPRPGNVIPTNERFRVKPALKCGKGRARRWSQACEAEVAKAQPRFRRSYGAPARYGSGRKPGEALYSAHSLAMAQVPSRCAEAAPSPNSRSSGGSALAQKARPHCSCTSFTEAPRPGRTPRSSAAGRSELSRSLSRSSPFR